MSEQHITCPMCGYAFNPHENRTCEACPMHRSCSLVCCPACGYNVIDPGQSSIGSWLSGLFKWGDSEEGRTSIT